MSEVKAQATDSRPRFPEPGDGGAFTLIGSSNSFIDMFTALWRGHEGVSIREIGEFKRHATRIRQGAVLFPEFICDTGGGI
ncbi:hypothetical protein L3X38_041564 [Prunus dulcis]|uniref:Uncharacterized protein n=1 Tax=Prunus dulcis TaxID=3755 RepID=A0AAD4UV02_PRUDU|nr:hypothetical protein L3X38_041564 [Prunus dulcis]